MPLHQQLVFLGTPHLNRPDVQDTLECLGNCSGGSGGSTGMSREAGEAYMPWRNKVKNKQYFASFDAFSRFPIDPRSSIKEKPR